VPALSPRDCESIERFLAEAPIFYQPWWLEGVSPGQWDYAVVRRGSETAAVMPFVKRRHPLGQVSLGMPSLTQTLGPWLPIPPAGDCSQLAEQEDLLTELIEALPPHTQFRQHFHYSQTNWLPFCWRGYRQTTRCTYVLQDLGDLDAVWKGFSEKVRTEIRKAEKVVRVAEDLGLDCFLDLNELTFRRQGRKPPHSRDFLLRLDTACAIHDARRILFAVDAENRVHAACYVIWTRPAAYYLMGGAVPDLRNSGATSLLLWEAIRFSSRVARTFDFEGSMIESVEHFFREFGPRQLPYFSVSKDERDPLVRTYTGLRSLVGKSTRAFGFRR
jgi:hypothetical protein